MHQRSSFFCCIAHLWPTAILLLYWFVLHFDKQVQGCPFSLSPILQCEDCASWCKQLESARASQCHLLPQSNFYFTRGKLLSALQPGWGPLNNLRGNLANTNWGSCVVWSHPHDCVSSPDYCVKLKWCFSKKLRNDELRMGRIIFSQSLGACRRAGGLNLFFSPLMLSLMGEHKLCQQYKKENCLPAALKQGQQRN